jgi:hypothetical protein
MKLKKRKERMRELCHNYATGRRLMFDENLRGNHGYYFWCCQNIKWELIPLVRQMFAEDVLNIFCILDFTKYDGNFLFRQLWRITIGQKSLVDLKKMRITKDYRRWH